jgi:hypothetical protein
VSTDRLVFNPPPGWPTPPPGWRPPRGWKPDPSWPTPPEGWELWLPAGAPSSVEPVSPEAAAEADEPLRRVGDVTHPSSELEQRIAVLESENRELRAQLQEVASASVGVLLDDDRVLQESGIYRYHHPLENAAAYRERLREISCRIAEAVKTGQAIEMSTEFTLDNSLAKGRKLTSSLAKLMLRAYNAEADNCLRSLRIGNVATSKQRLYASRTAIATLGSMMEMRITDFFHRLREEEIELTADFIMKKQQEREAAREERERLREERKVAQELAEERGRLDKERAHLLNAVEAIRTRGLEDATLERKLQEIDEAIARNDYRAANIRAGYVYVISNRGAFGANVVKIGLTRRLEPLERVDELGGASVPFRFDVHGLFFSEDAVTLELELHRHFSGRRLNHANPRKEFFFAAPEEVREVLAEKVGSLLEYNDHADSTEYLQSLQYWPDSRRGVGSG